MRYRGRRKRELAVKKEDLSFCNHPCLQSIYTTDIKLNCQCGHIGQNLFSWKFGDTNGGEVNFVDTDTVLGNTYLQSDRHHYWEIKILQPLQDKQLDIGIAAYSNDGRMQKFTLSSNAKMASRPGSRKIKSRLFCAGSLVGVHLDTIRGKLNFTVNRAKDVRWLEFSQSIPMYQQIKPLLYTQSRDVSFKLLYSTCYEETLEFSSAKSISETLDYGLVNSLPGHIQNVLHKNFPVLFTEPKYQDLFIALDHEDVSVDSPQKTATSTTRKKSVLDKVSFEDYASSSDDEYIFILKPKTQLLDPEKLSSILNNAGRKKCSSQRGSQRQKNKIVETAEVPDKKSSEKSKADRKHTKKKTSSRVLKPKNT